MKHSELRRQPRHVNPRIQDKSSYLHPQNSKKLFRPSHLYYIRNHIHRLHKEYLVVHMADQMEMDI